MIDIGLKFIPTPARDLKVKITELELKANFANLRDLLKNQS